MYPQLSALTSNRAPQAQPAERERRRARLLDKARLLRRLARSSCDLWLAEQYEAAASII